MSLYLLNKSLARLAQQGVEDAGLMPWDPVNTNRCLTLQEWKPLAGSAGVQNGTVQLSLFP